MKNFEDTEQYYYWNFFSKRIIIGTYKNYKSKWENGKNKWILIIANYKNTIVMKIININRWNKNVPDKNTSATSAER